jgi:CHASE2 domain-containing sensor protein
MEIRWVYLEGDPLAAAVKIPTKVKYLIWAGTIGIWIAEALAAREPLNADAVSYLNMADAYLGGTWHALINGWWSPAYPFLIAQVVKILYLACFNVR